MKLRVYKSIFYTSIIMLWSQFLIAQPKSLPPFGKELNAPVKLRINDARSDFKINAIKLELAKLQFLVKDMEVKIAPQIANIEKHLENAFADLDQHVVIIDGPDFPRRDRDIETDIQASEKVRTILKTYSVGSNDKLAINNQYGKVVIHTWAKKEIKVEVEIKAYESSDKKAQELLDAVTIAEARQGDLISFKTSFNKSNMNWWSRTKNGNEEKRGVQVNYTVYMPSKNPLDITNRYGSTTLPDFEGPLNISSSYGSLTAEKLANPANRIKVSYGSATVESFSTGVLDVSYGSLKLANADKLTSDIRYSSAKIGSLTNSGKIDVAYGSCRIEELNKNVQNLIINSSYSGLTMGIDETANFNFDVTVSYAGFNYNDAKINITRKTPDENAKGYNPTKNYIGTYGKGSDSKIVIKCNYGGVKFL